MTWCLHTRVTLLEAACLQLCWKVNEPRKFCPQVEVVGVWKTCFGLVFFSPCDTIGGVLNVLAFFWRRIKLLTFLFLCAHMWERERQCGLCWKSGEDLHSWTAHSYLNISQRHWVLRGTLQMVWHSSAFVLLITCSSLSKDIRCIGDEVVCLFSSAAVSVSSSIHRGQQS